MWILLFQAIGQSDGVQIQKIKNNDVQVQKNKNNDVHVQKKKE